MELHRHLNPNGMLGGLTDRDVPPNMYVLHEDEVARIIDDYIASVCQGEYKKMFDVATLAYCKRLREPIDAATYENCLRQLSANLVRSWNKNQEDTYLTDMRRSWVGY